MTSPLHPLWWKFKALVLGSISRCRHHDERVCPEGDDACSFAGHLEVYRFMGQFVRGKAVLDVGCGTGYGSHYLLEQGARTVCGIDYADEAIRYATTHYRHPQLTYRQMNAEKLEFPAAAFEVVTTSENLEHLHRPEANIAEIRRVLAPGGTLLLGTPNRDISSAGLRRSPNPHHVHEFTFDELDALIRRHFQTVHIFETTFEGEGEVKRLKDERRRRGRLGLETRRQTTLQLGPHTVDLTHLNNSHSFMVIAW